MFVAAFTLQQCTTEQAALLAIYNENGGDSWTGAPLWATATPYCNWEGVKCDYQGFVQEIDLSGFGLTGQLTTEIGCFPHLKTLYLNNEQMTSTIPTSICNLLSLQYLQLNSAGLTGTIPTCICQMQNLMYFYADFNIISGALPTCVGNMTFLREMHMKCNTLSGIIPTGFNSLNYLTELRVNCNADLDCSSALATKSNFIFLCGDINCADCTITPNQCPAYVDIPNCGRYYRQV